MDKKLFLIIGVCLIIFIGSLFIVSEIEDRQSSEEIVISKSPLTGKQSWDIINGEDVGEVIFNGN